MTSSTAPRPRSPRPATDEPNTDAAGRGPESQNALGPSIRQRRESIGLSLRALAERVGISASALSHIEKGRSQPSVSTLFALARELDISLDELFSADPSPVPGRQPATPTGTTVVQYAADRKPLEVEAGIVWEGLARDGDVQFFQLSYEPGAASAPSGSYVRHAGREYGVVLRGRLRMTLGFQEYDLGPGDSIRFDANVPHRLENIGDEPLEAVWVMVGRTGGAVS